MSEQPVKTPVKIKRWPMIQGRPGERRTIDKERVKQLYLNGSHADWTLFCQAHGFNDSKRQRQEFPLSQWKKLWIDFQIAAQNDKAMVDATVARPKLLSDRILHIGAWKQSADTLKVLLDTAAHNYLLNHKFNQDHATAIEAGSVKARKVPSTMDLKFLAEAMLKGQELDRNALLIGNADSANSNVLPLPEQKPEEQQGDNEIAEMRAEKYSLLGVPASATMDEIKHNLANYFDQSKQPLELEAEDPFEDKPEPPKPPEPEIPVYET